LPIGQPNLSRGITNLTASSSSEVDIVESRIATAGIESPAVLIAEDEFMIRMAISSSLADEGITVYEAATAAEAIDMLETDAEIDLVFSDICMPGLLDGLDLARWVHDHRPNLSVVLTSGDVRKSQLADDAGPFIAKPYDFESVATYIVALARANKKARAQ
jgi:CheY-like chemotaxis protein